jgi:hypothetical protein
MTRLPRASFRPEPFPPDPHGDLGIAAGEKLELYPERSQYGWCFCVVIANPSRRGWVSRVWGKRAVQLLLCDRQRSEISVSISTEIFRCCSEQVPGNYISANGRDSYVSLDDQSAQPQSIGGL